MSSSCEVGGCRSLIRMRLGPAGSPAPRGLGHSGNWVYQLPTLVHAGYRVVPIDSRRQGRSTRDPRPYSYELMASGVRSYPLDRTQDVHPPASHSSHAP